MERLSGQDASFLYLETPSAHMHVAGIGIFDPSTAPEPFTRERVLQLIGERLPLVPAFRRRLATVPFEIHHPVWYDDPDFDLERHVRFVALPSPGGDAELAELTADITSRPLDRAHPLWEMWIIEGLEDGKYATVSKTHHAAIDGVSGVDLTVALLDLEPSPPPVQVDDDWTPERRPTDWELLNYAIASQLRQPARVARAAPSLARGMWRTARGGPARSPELPPPPGLLQGPNTSLNGAIGPHRKVSYRALSLDDVKAVKRGLGGTVNDVVLALCSGTLRRYFAERGEEVDSDLLAMVPISVRTEDQQGTLGNRVSSMLVSLASTIDDPVERLHAISEGTRGAKEQHNAIGATTLQDMAEFAPPGLAARAARLYSRMRLADRHRPFYNLTISNVPGPPIPLYSLGSKMVASYPLGPINEGTALNITVLSYLDQMFFGLHADRDSVGDVWALAAGLQESLDELLKALPAR